MRGVQRIIERALRIRREAARTAGIGRRIAQSRTRRKRDHRCFGITRMSATGRG
jgi:hypothetical protein